MYLTSFLQHLTKGIVGGVFLRLMDAYYEALDGMIITTPEVYEPHAITATKDWFAETSRFVWAIGPLQTFSEGKQAIFNEEAQSERSQDIRKHLDSAFSDYGEHSVLYVGSPIPSLCFLLSSEFQMVDRLRFGCLATRTREA